MSAVINLKIALAAVSIVVGVLLNAVVPGPEGSAAGLVVAVITFWVTGVIPEHLTAIMLFAVAMLFSISPANVVFSGFHSNAFWLVFSGLVIGVGINGTGLGKRMAAKVAHHLKGNYFKLIAGLVATGAIFGFIMPSAMGRIVLLVPITVALANHFGFEKESNGYTAVILAVVLGSFIPAFSILPANVPNMILAGMTESLYRYSPLYGEYLLLHFPVLGFLKAAFIIALILWLYPDQPAEGQRQTLKGSDVMTKKEKMLSGVLVILIALWATDFIHNVSPAWVALCGAVFLLLPKVEIVSKKQFAEKINYNSLFFIAGILGLGSIINDSGLGTQLAKWLASHLPLRVDVPFVNFASLGLSSMLTGVVTTLPGVPAILTPLSGDLSHATGLPLQSVFMTQVIGFSTPIFPYQAPPILIGMQLAQVRLTEAFKVCLVLAIVSIILLWPLNYLWWKYLGWL